MAIDSAAESYLSAVGVMDVVAATRSTAGEFDYDAVVLAGFGEHGRDALAEMLSVPVFDIAECAAHVAHLIGRRFSVVTTLARSIAPIEDRLLLAGLNAHCASVRACGLGTAEVDADPAGAVQAIVDEAARAVAEDGADVICLGCAGMAGVTGGDLGEARRARDRRGRRGGRAGAGRRRARAVDQQGRGVRTGPGQPAQPLADLASAGAVTR